MKTTVNKRHTYKNTYLYIYKVSPVPNVLNMRNIDSATYIIYGLSTIEDLTKDNIYTYTQAHKLTLQYHTLRSKQIQTWAI